MKVNVYGNVFGDLGYNVHTRGFAEGLIENNFDVKIVPRDIPTSRSQVSRMLAEGIKKKHHIDAPSINISYGNDMMKFYGSQRIGYTVWETTRIPPDWVEQLNALDDVWTVSKFCKKSFEDSGVTKDVKIVHEGVDTTIFHPYVDKLQKKDPEYFTFLSIFKWEDRKSPDILLEAFSEEFDPKEKVGLVLQCYNPFIRDFDPYERLFGLNLPKHAPINVVPPVQTHADLARLYASADCFVLPTKGESWGLPLIESLACGTPVITTNFGGSLEFVDKDIGWLIDVEKMETPDDGMFFKPYKDNEWAVPSKTHLRELMRHAFEHEEECKKKGFAGYEKMDSQFTWKKSTEVVKELIR